MVELFFDLQRHYPQRSLFAQWWAFEAAPCAVELQGGACQEQVDGQDIQQHRIAIELNGLVLKKGTMVDATIMASDNRPLSTGR